LGTVQGPMVDLLIAGAGGFGREVASLVDDINRAQSRWRLVGFLDRPGERDRTVRGLPVLDAASASSLAPDTQAVIAVGDPQVKERIVGQVEQLGLPFATLVHPTALMDSSVTLGSGSIVCAGSILTVNIVVGAHVSVNPGCTIGHDAVIGEYSTLAPGCHISGEATIGRSVMLGTGACMIQQTKIGDGTIVGAGAVVVRDIPSGVTAVGVPAKPR
jgi:sugar O-acyltransferase (sialic acid O-acetyltransferase NeuD family)